MHMKRIKNRNVKGVLFCLAIFANTCASAGRNRRPTPMQAMWQQQQRTQGAVRRVAVPRTRTVAPLPQRPGLYAAAQEKKEEKKVLEEVVLPPIARQPRLALMTEEPQKESLEVLSLEQFKELSLEDQQRYKQKIAALANLFGLVQAKEKKEEVVQKEPEKKEELQEKKRSLQGLLERYGKIPFLAAESEKKEDKQVAPQSELSKKLALIAGFKELSKIILGLELDLKKSSKEIKAVDSFVKKVAESVDAVTQAIDSISQKALAGVTLEQVSWVKAIIPGVVERFNAGMDGFQNMLISLAKDLKTEDVDLQNMVEQYTHFYEGYTQFIVQWESFIPKAQEYLDTYEYSRFINKLLELRAAQQIVGTLPKELQPKVSFVIDSASINIDDRIKQMAQYLEVAKENAAGSLFLFVVNPLIHGGKVSSEKDFEKVTTKMVDDFSKNSFEKGLLLPDPERKAWLDAQKTIKQLVPSDKAKIDRFNKEVKESFERIKLSFDAFYKNYVAVIANLNESLYKQTLQKMKQIPMNRLDQKDQFDAVQKDLQWLQVHLKGVQKKYDLLKKDEAKMPFEAATQVMELIAQFIDENHIKPYNELCSLYTKTIEKKGLSSWLGIIWKNAKAAPAELPLLYREK